MLHLCPYSRLSHCCWCFHSSAFVHLSSRRWSGGGCHVDLALVRDSAGPRSLWCLLLFNRFVSLSIFVGLVSWLVGGVVRSYPRLFLHLLHLTLCPASPSCTLLASVVLTPAPWPTAVAPLAMPVPSTSLCLSLSILHGPLNV